MTDPLLHIDEMSPLYALTDNFYSITVVTLLYECTICFTL